MRIGEVGLTVFDEALAEPGFTLISPLQTKAAYLLGMQGEVLHRWSFPLTPGCYAYLLPGGNILWSGRVEDGPNPGGGKGGLLQEYDWDGNLLWEYADNAQHHDFQRLRNGNTLYIGWEEMPAKAAARMIGAAEGSEAKGGITWSDYLREVTPTGETAWEWHAHSDMVIEDFPLNPLSTRAEFAHCNTCTELPDGNILLSFRKISTIAIIDKQTRETTWHQRDEEWGQQHDCQMLDNGNILLFANGIHVPRGRFHSRVVEINPETGETEWEYIASPPYTLFSPNISGCQRLPGGNTLICEGLSGRVLEVTVEGRIVWEYICPYFGRSELGLENSVFRAYRYAEGSPEIENRLRLP